MSLPPLVPPLKCQGIKTKLAGEISRIAQTQGFERWVEPFCGSCVVALNVQPKQAPLSDSNVHIIRLYQEIQNGSLTPANAKSFLTEEGDKLRADGETYYYAVRERFNAKPSSLDFLFLNRSCFNGVMRFNRHAKFNVPYGHKPERFAQAYVTKSQIKSGVSPKSFPRRIGRLPRQISDKPWHPRNRATWFTLTRPMQVVMLLFQLMVGIGRDRTWRYSKRAPVQFYPLDMAQQRVQNECHDRSQLERPAFPSLDPRAFLSRRFD